LMSCENTLLKKRNTLAKMLKRTVLSIRWDDGELVIASHPTSSFHHALGWNPKLVVWFSHCRSISM
jgi:hypothetical protein